MSLNIAIDIGGTQLRAASYAKHSLEPIRISRIPTRSGDATPLDRLFELVSSIWPENESVAAIGVAAPGPTDPYEGVIIEAPNIPGWFDIHLRQHLETRFHVPVAVGNDANLAALGEWKFGAGQGHHHLIYMTISTGIGGGIIINDQLLLGSRGLAAEIGHVTVMPDGPVCGCGQPGHLEAVASGTAIARWVQQELSQGAKSSLPAGQTLTGPMISRAAQAGDALALAALERAGTFIGVAIADLLHIFNPTAIILGGGVSHSGKFLLDPLSKALRQHVLNEQYLQGLVMMTAALGDEAGLMGALALSRSLSSE